MTPSINQTLVLALKPGVAEMAERTARRNGDGRWANNFAILALTRKIFYGALVSSAIGMISIAATQSEGKLRLFTATFTIVSIGVSALTGYTLARLVRNVQKRFRAFQAQRVAALGSGLRIVRSGPINLPLIFLPPPTPTTPVVLAGPVLPALTGLASKGEM